MTTDPADYPWSSHGHNAMGQHRPLITAHPEYMRLASTSSARQTAYRALVLESLDEQQITDLRLHTQQQRAWGSERFREQIEALTHRAAGARPRGRPRKLADTRSK